MDQFGASIFIIFGSLLSLVGAVFSATGFIYIFSGSPIAVGIMGGCFELAKLAAASFLFLNWKRVGILMKAHLVLSVFILMGVSSVGSLNFFSATYENSVRKLGEARELSGLLQGEISRQEAELKQSQKPGNAEQLDAAAKIRATQLEILNKKMAKSNSIIATNTPPVQAVDFIAKRLEIAPSQAARLSYIVLILIFHPAALFVFLLGIRSMKNEGLR